MANPDNLFFDGFDGYGDDTAFSGTGVYGSTRALSPFIMAGGRFGGQAIQQDIGGSFALRGITPTAEYCMGIAFRMPFGGWTAPLSRQILGANGFGVTDQVSSIRVTDQFGLELWMGGALAYAHPVLLGSNTWHYVELHHLIDSSVGRIELWLNGQRIYNVTGNTLYGVLTTQVGSVSIGARPVTGSAGLGTNGTQLDDHYFKNGAVPLGPVRVEQFLPTSELSNTGFTAVGAGTTFDAVDDLLSSSLGDYVEAGLVSDEVVFDSTGVLSSAPSQIHGVRILGKAGKNDAGVRSVAPVIRPASTTFVGNSVVLADSNHFLSEVWATNPQTSGAWLQAALELTKFGIKVAA